ncbi:TIGR00299 family protein, partial [Methanosarcinales archaeon]
MKCLLFNPFSGASGDMILASLIDLGADPEAVRGAVSAICGDKVVIKQQDVKRGGIAAKQAIVETSDHAKQTYPEVLSLLRNGK